MKLKYVVTGEIEATDEIQALSRLGDALSKLEGGGISFDARITKDETKTRQ